MVSSTETFRFPCPVIAWTSEMIDSSHEEGAR